MLNKKNSIPEEIEEGYFRPIEVIVRGNNFEKAFKNFRSLVQFEQVISLYKEKQSFDKPSIKRRKKHLAHLADVRDEERKQAKIASGEFEKEKLRKLAKKEKKKLEREEQKAKEGIE